MLGQRIVTALVLLGMLVLTLKAPSAVPFAALMLTFAAVGAWEWGRMNGSSPAMAVGQGAVVVALGGLCATLQWLPPALPAWFWPLVTAAWLLLLAVALSRGIEGWARLPALGRAEAGWLIMAVTWLAVLALYRRGIPFLLSVCCIVWACDIGAYFAGRSLGRSKLAPQISPGKTREGLAGGMLAAMALGLIWWGVAPAGQESFFSLIGARHGAGGVVLWTGLLASLSAMGDLFESLVKRAAGVKDSSNVLPGHGGVLDRFDALLPTLPAALALIGWLA